MMSRIVVSGVGLVTPLGADRESSWSRLLAGERAARRLEITGDRQDGIHAADERLDGTTWIGAPACRDRSRDTNENFDPVTLLALQAAHEALRDANAPQDFFQRERMGCIVGTSKGGLSSFSRLDVSRRKNENLNDAEFSALFGQIFPHAVSRALANRYRLQGPSLAPVAACATGLVCLVRAAEMIREGVCDCVVAGSVDASLLPIVLGSFRRLGVLARHASDPRAACRPFDRDRCGFVVGEGAAIFTLEREETARKRGAPIWGEWVTGRLASDPQGMMALEPSGESLTWLIGETLRVGNISPSELDYVNLHGTGTTQNDLCETRALHAALNDRASGIICSGQKGSIGHLLGAAGSVETAFTLLALRDQIVPPTMNLEHPDDACDLNYAAMKAVPRAIDTALKLSLGFGGHLAAGLLRRID